MISGCEKRSNGRPDALRTPSYSAEGWAQGHWVRYEYSVGGGKPAAITVAVTGTEARNHAEYFWLEVWYENGGYRRATRVLIPELKPADFFRAEGDIPPGAIEVLGREGVMAPYRLSVDEAINPVGTSLQDLFGGGPGAVLSEKTSGVGYEALSGKGLECDEAVVLIGVMEKGNAYVCEEVPVTGVARSIHGPTVLELVDFGVSGAGSIFNSK
jgi:hypothetical protein